MKATIDNFDKDLWFVKGGKGHPYQRLYSYQLTRIGTTKLFSKNYRMTYYELTLRDKNDRTISITEGGNIVVTGYMV